MPLLSIVEATGEEVIRRGLHRVGLLGTVFTMREAFYRDGLARRGLDVVTPGEADQAFVNSVIYDELCRGEIRDESRQGFRDVVSRLVADGAQGIVLGCTEIPLLLRTTDCESPLFNTTLVHAEAALNRAVRSGG
jgi:aspartate racemase